MSDHCSVPPDRGVDNFLEVGGLSLYGAVGSNLRMVRPSSMSVVKLLIIPAREARGKILDLAIFSSQVALSLHFSFKLGVTITLLPYLARNLKFDKILRKHLRFFVLQPML